MTNEKYQFHNFLKYKTIAHGISSKVNGSMKNQETMMIDREVLANFAETIGITGDIVCMKQIHGGNVQNVKDSTEIRFPESDGLITNKKNVPIAVLTADCLPVLFFDPKKEVIAVSHAGYRGLLNNIIENTIKRFISDFSSDPKDILVGIGPGIEMTCYEVLEDRIKEFDKTFPKFENICSQMGGRVFLNLHEVALQCLYKEGILKEHIEVMQICTKCDPNFYSYRGGESGRMMSVISLL